MYYCKSEVGNVIIHDVYMMQCVRSKHFIL